MVFLSEVMELECLDRFTVVCVCEGGYSGRRQGAPGLSPSPSNDAALHPGVAFLPVWLSGTLDGGCY